MYDIIGDIHGHADQLEQLLQKIGYSLIDGIYSHPDRKVIFIGDYIDRGPKIRETLMIVKSMVELGSAIALMGNHEYNALCYHSLGKNGKYLREHNNKNKSQHKATLEQFEFFGEEWQKYLQWFITLPLFYENSDFRAVHACWSATEIQYLKSKLSGNCLSQDLLEESTEISSNLHLAVEITLKGREIQMPEGLFFLDKDGQKRSELRVKWWEKPIDQTYKSYSVEEMASLPDEKFSHQLANNIPYYNENEKLVIIGHYWLKGLPKKLSNNVVCVDYSIAKGGLLTAYSSDSDEFSFVM